MRLRPILAVAVAGAAWTPCAAFAQDTSAQGGAAASTIEEVVVTARRREEALQDVPVAITALTGSALAEKNIRDIDSLQRSVPGLSVSALGTQDRSRLNFIIRGQQATYGFPNDSVVAYFAEVPTNAVGKSLFYDLQNVQVLKGPQGTLFGRNTTGGAVLFEPARPTQHFEGGVGVRAGSYNKLESDGYINIPVNDTLAVRLAYNVGHTKGYIRDVAQSTDLEGETYQGARLGVTWNPTDDVSNYFVASWYRERSTGNHGRITGIYPTTTAPDGTVFRSLALGISPGLTGSLIRQQARSPYVVENSVVDPHLNIDAHTATDILTWRVNDSLTFKNVAGYRYFARSGSGDTDGSAFPVVDNLPITNWGEHQQQFSEEAQLQYQSKLFDVIGGGFYLKDKPTSLDRFNGGYTVSFGTGSFRPNYFTTTSKAIYSQVTFKPLPGLNINGGLRYTWDRVASDSGQFTQNATTGVVTCSAGFSPATNCMRHLVTNNKKLTYLFGADYKVMDAVMIYGNVRRGYRTGGINGFLPPSAAIDPSFGPEVNDDIELGLKSDFRAGDMPVRANAAIYRSKLKGAQRSTIIPNVIPLATATLNAAGATIKGFEGDITIVPARGVTLGAFYAYTDASYDTFFMAEYGQDVSSMLPWAFVPKNKFGVSFSGEHDLGKPGTLALNLDYTWQSKVYWSSKPISSAPGNLIRNPQTGRYVVGQDPSDTEPSYGLLNGRLTLKEVGGSNLDLSIWCTNCTDKFYNRWVLGSTWGSIGIQAKTAAAPRMFGVEARYHFE